MCLASSVSPLRWARLACPLASRGLLGSSRFLSPITQQVTCQPDLALWGASGTSAASPLEDISTFEGEKRSECESARPMRKRPLLVVWPSWSARYLSSPEPNAGFFASSRWDEFLGWYGRPSDPVPIPVGQDCVRGLEGYPRGANLDQISTATLTKGTWPVHACGDGRVRTSYRKTPCTVICRGSNRCHRFLVGARTTFQGIDPPRGRRKRAPQVLPSSLGWRTVPCG